MRIGFVLFVVLGLAGCATGILTGAGEGGYHRPSPDGRSAEQVRADQAITAQVNRVLVADRLIPVMAVEVTTVYGNVTLRGRVPDRLTAQRAVTVAGSVPGVRAVVDRLDVVR
jgi:osmotically-inducible protein OsmY